MFRPLFWALAGVGVWVATASGQVPGYVEAGVCAQCHGDVARTYAKTGMARSFGAIRADNTAAMFPAGAYRHAASEQSFEMALRDGKAILRRYLTGTAGSARVEEREAQVDYWVGSGNHGRGFVTRSAAGKLAVLPVTYYSENGGSWGMNPGYDRPDHTGFDRKISYRCLSCHAGVPDFPAGADAWPNGSDFSGKLVEGIDCQRCHGPGAEHVSAARQGLGVERVRAAIVNPARLGPDRQMDVCMQCHLETTSLTLPGEMMRFDRTVYSYRPGTPLGDWTLSFDYAPGTGHDDRFEFVSSAYRLRQSACFRESKGALTCITCHNPHDIPRGEAATRHYTEVCRNCHAAKVSEMVRAGQHPASQDCVSCHMPKRTPVDAVHVQVADHFIRKRPEPSPARAMVEQNDSNTPPYRGEVKLYYPAALRSGPDGELYLAVAQVQQQANLEAGAARLEELVTRYQPKEGRFYLELGEAWRKLGRLDKAGPRLEEAVRRMPGDWHPLFALATALSAIGRFDVAAETLVRAGALAPKETTVLAALGEAYLRQNKPAEAAATFRRALAIDPEFAEADNNLATALLRSGDAAGAEKALREAVRLRPESASIRVNLATLLARSGQFPEARAHFERALRLDPDFAEGHSAFGTALVAAGSTAEARKQYEAALATNPALPVTHNNLATLLRQAGDSEGAIREFREAVRYSPDYYEAYLGLGALLVARGDRPGAEPHLRKAAQSSDPRIRQQAEALLRR